MAGTVKVTSIEKARHQKRVKENPKLKQPIPPEMLAHDPTDVRVGENDLRYSG